MDNTTSEATSLHSASEYSSMYNQSNHAYQCHSQRQQDEGTSHSQATQDQFLQGDASRQARLGGRRATLSEHEKRERIRLNHVNYRQRKKDKVNEMAAQNQHFQDEIRHLTSENRQLKVENGRLSVENRQLKEESGRLSTENRQLKAENERLSAENRHLKAETGRLSAENRHLKEETRRLYLENKLVGDHIRGLRDKGQLPAEVPERQDSSISQPTCQVDQQNVYVQDHYETGSNCDARVYRGHHFVEYMHNEGAADELFDINELLNPIPRENEMASNGPVAVNEPVIEHPESSQSCTCPAEVAKIKLQKFLTELDAEVTSNVDPSDFTGLEGEHRRVGRFSFPSSLIPIVERIKFHYGDVSEKCRISPCISGTIYVLLCATIREMEHRRLEQVTESTMLKWRDVIKDALLLGFNVRFAMEHLKEIASAYFGLPGRQFIQGIDSKVLTLEAEINDWMKKRAMIYEASRISIDAAEKFIGVPVSTAGGRDENMILKLKQNPVQVQASQWDKFVICVWLRIQVWQCFQLMAVYVIVLQNQLCYVKEMNNLRVKEVSEDIINY